MSTEMGKFKLLNLIRIFEEYTDAQKGLTMPQLIEKLEECGISAERKALYRDIKALRDFGFDIQKAHCSPVEYRLCGRRFSYSELQLLADAVQSSRFLTKSSVDRLLHNLRTLCSVRQAKTLSRRLHVSDRVNMQNESAFRNIDVVNEAIVGHRKIEFTYFKYDCSKKPVPQHGGAIYCETPMHLVLSSGLYYMVAYNDKHDDIVTYRVDRMKDVRVSGQQAARNQKIANFDVAEYEKRAFGMYAGDPVSVTLCVAQDAMGGVIDRFGKEVSSLDRGDGTAEVHVQVMASDSFFAWLMQFGSQVRIEAPSSLAKEYKHRLLEIAANYE